MAEIADTVASAAKTAPAMLVAAKESLEDKQNKIDELSAELNKLQNEHKTYKAFYERADETARNLDAERSVTEKLRADIADHEVTIND
eukprot:SAG31_NODE_36117_length_316_cov_0.944700_1_plen_87_part_10